MAMIECEECEARVSNKAKACIHCGAPILTETETQNDNKAYVDTKTLQDSPRDSTLKSFFTESSTRSSLPDNEIRPSAVGSSREIERPVERKSLAAALLLTFFFGPFGLCYVNVSFGLILGFIWLLSFIFTLGVFAFIPWIVGMVFAAIDVENFNNGKPPTFS